MTSLIRWLILASLVSFHCYADVGILLPGDSAEPDPSLLSMQEVHIDIRVDHQYARVRMQQIFANHAGTNLEGKYVFAIPGNAEISDFAVWDGVVRIPGVILERKRASELYEQIRMQEIDPGLLQQEEGAEGPRMASAFSARIVPIPPYGTKRLEIEYTQHLNIEGMKSYFNLPLKPDLFRIQKAGQFTLNLEISSDASIANFRPLSNLYPLQYEIQSGQNIRGSFSGSNVDLAEDFSFEYTLQEPASALQFLSYRGSERSLRAGSQPVTVFEKPSSNKIEDGYFWLSALFHENESSSPKISPRSLLILLDISSSMRWEKLDQSYRALEYFLENLTEQDEFQLLLFHQETKLATQTPVLATKHNVDSALAFMKSQYLMGGTDLEKTIQHAFELSPGFKNKDRYLVLITDGNPTLTQLQTAKLLQQFSDGNQKAGMRAFCFGIGTDANRNLLSDFASRSNGYFDWGTENENLQFKLQSFFAKIGQLPISGITARASQPDLVYQVYPSDPAQAYDGSAIDWFGRYKEPANDVTMTVSGSWKEKPIELAKRVTFAPESVDHPFIPRGWARARVDALLRKIDLQGEDDATIDEIISLSKKYKFITPYTSFLAAPRSLLRPRVIRPGDPLLRVRTDPDIVSVVAIFPFGLIKKLEYLETEEVWQTRFLVPKEMKDGGYDCRLILRDRMGQIYEEKKSFLVDSKPPEFRIRTETRFARGTAVKIRISADQDTRSILAKLDTLPAIRIVWDARERAAVGFLKVPADMPSGVYKLQVIGEDFAHNETRMTQRVEIY